MYSPTRQKTSARRKGSQRPASRRAVFLGPLLPKTGVSASDLDQVVILNVSSLCSKRRRQKADQHWDVISELFQCRSCITRLKCSGILFFLVTLGACQPHCWHTTTTTPTQWFAKNALTETLTKSSSFCFMIWRFLWLLICKNVTFIRLASIALKGEYGPQNCRLRTAVATKSHEGTSFTPPVAFRVHRLPRENIHRWIISAIFQNSRAPAFRKTWPRCHLER